MASLELPTHLQIYFLFSRKYTSISLMECIFILGKKSFINLCTINCKPETTQAQIPGFSNSELIAV